MMEDSKKNKEKPKEEPKKEEIKKEEPKKEEIKKEEVKKVEIKKEEPKVETKKPKNDSDSEEEIKPKAVAKRKVNIKDSDSDDEPKKEIQPKRKVNIKDNSDSEDEKKKPVAKKPVKKDSSDDGPVTKVSKKPVKKVDSSDDEEPKKAPVVKKPIKKTDSSDDEPINVKRPTAKKVASSSDDEPTKKPVKKLGTAVTSNPPAKKADSSDDEPVKKSVQRRVKKAASSSSDDEPAKKPVKKAEPISSKPPVKKAAGSSDDEPVKKVVKKPIKKVDSSSDDEPVRKVVKKPTKKADSSDDEPKKKTPVVKKPVKKVESSSDDEPKKKPVQQKKPVKKDDSSDEEPKRVVKKVVKKVESSDDEPVKKVVKKPVKKVNSSSDDEPKKKPVQQKKLIKKDDSSDDEPKKKKPTAKKTAAKKQDSDTDSDDLRESNTSGIVAVKQQMASDSDDEPKKVVKKKVYSSDSDDEPKKKKLVKKPPKKQVDSDDESDDDSKKKPTKKKPQATKKVSSSDDDSGKEKAPKKEVPTKKVESSDDDSGKEKPVVEKKVVPKNDDTSDDDSGNERAHKKDTHNSDEEVEKMKKNIIKEFKLPNSIREGIQKLDYFIEDGEIVIQIINYLQGEFQEDEDEFIEQVLKNDGLQTFVSTCEFHYDNKEVTEKLLPHIYNISKGDESRYHLIRLMNGVDIMSKYMCQFNAENLPKKYFRYAFQIFEFVLTKKTDYSTEYLNTKTEELSKIIQLSNELILMDKKFANSFAKFIYNLSLYEGNVHILFKCGATRPMIRILENYCEKNLDILNYYHQYITFMKPDEYEITSQLFSEGGSKGPIRTLVLEVMAKNDSNTNVQNICGDIIQRMSHSDVMLIAIYEIWNEKPEDQALSFCISRIIQCLTIRGNIPKEVLEKYANSPIIQLCASLMKGFPSIGWVINCCVEFLSHVLKNCEQKDKEKIIKEFSKTEGINSLNLALREFSANEEFSIFIVTILDEFSKDERGINSLKKSIGFLPPLLDFVEIYSSNKAAAKLGYDVLIRYATEIDFGDKKEISPEMTEEFLSFVLKKMEESKNDITTAINCFKILKEMSDDTYIPQLTTANSRMLFDIYQTHLKNEQNDELLFLVFECFGKFGKDSKKIVFLFILQDKNRATFSKQLIVENLKKLYKQNSGKPEFEAIAKEAKKNLGL